MQKKTSVLVIAFAALFLCLFVSATSWADADQIDESLPDAVLAQLHIPLQRVGAGSYYKFGFTIYHASLWAPNGVWDAAKPYALKLKYARSLSKETLVGAVMDDIRDQGVANDETLARWQKVLDESLPAVEEDDTIIGLTMPGKKALLFYNGKIVTAIDDQAFSKAFFNIWLGKNADDRLCKQLLGQSE